MSDLKFAYKQKGEALAASNVEHTSVKTKILNLLKTVHRPGMDQVINLLQESNFFEVQCNVHHVFVGGAAKHSLGVYERMAEACPQLDHESIIISALLHDICAAYHPHWTGIGGHGRRSTIILSSCGLQLTDEEYRAIRYHQNMPSPWEAKRHPLRKALIIADLLDAQKYRGPHRVFFDWLTTLFDF